MAGGWKGPSGAKPGNPPSGGSSVKPAALQPQPVLPVGRELLGETVIVKTPQMIGGQSEHAAIVTREHEDGTVNVILMPAAGESYPVEHVAPSGSGSLLFWRHRS